MNTKNDNIEQQILTLVNKRIENEVSNLKSKNQELIKEKRLLQKGITPRNFNNYTVERASEESFNDFIEHLKMLGINVVVVEETDSKIIKRDYTMHHFIYFLREGDNWIPPQMDGELAGYQIALMMNNFVTLVSTISKNFDELTGKDNAPIYILKNYDSFIWESDNVGFNFQLHIRNYG